MTNEQDRIEKTVDLAAPVDRVWRAITDHREFGAWFRVALDQPFAVGETNRGRITYEGYEHLTWSATVRAMEPQRYFAFTWCPLAEEPAEGEPRGPETLVEFRLEPTPDGTRLVVSESGFSAIADEEVRAESFLRNSEGWDIQTGNIAAHVES